MPTIAFFATSPTPSTGSRGCMQHKQAALPGLVRRPDKMPRAFTLLLVAVFLAAAGANGQSCRTVGVITQINTQLSSFAAALQKTGLASQFDSASYVGTIFAPSDAAFSAYTGPQDTESLTRLLKYHVVPDKAWYIPSLTNGQVLETLLPGQTLRIDKTGYNAQVIASGEPTPANVVTSDVIACLAVVEIIDEVLIPASLVRAGICSLACSHNQGAADQGAATPM
ncbi:hypothetical protein WJX73_004475 [Symbiochloris irregularis]|uniref:FAS1 domain-containing protein n=1 Tax=Symbiochloris irregularis TaxID=706552 RepID=A0AAW1PBR2_9CHLO